MLNATTSFPTVSLASAKVDSSTAATDCLYTKGRFVRPILECAPFAWMSAGPSHHKHLVQRRALGFIGDGTFLTCFSCYSVLLVQAPVHHRTSAADGYAPPAATPHLNPQTRQQQHTRPTFELDNTLPRSALDYLLRAFPFCILSTWNNLPCAVLPDRLQPRAFRSSRPCCLATF